jgi:hypothetical protein
MYALWTPSPGDEPNIRYRGAGRDVGGAGKGYGGLVTLTVPEL